MKLVIGLLVVALVVFADGLERSDRSRRGLSDWWDKIKEKIDDIKEHCKKEGDSCHGSLFDRCCGDMICHREEELEIQGVFEEGICVKCIEEDNVCQRDGQCCGQTLCVKERIYSINGVCKKMLEYGERCHFDDECESRNCNWEHSWSLKGKCDHPRGYHD